MGWKQALVLLVFFMSVVVCRSQTSPVGYDRKWAKVDSLMNRKGLTESALTEVNAIYALALKEQNDPQQIKASVYRFSLMGQKSEEAGPASIRELEKAVAGARQPAKAILENILASSYWEYFQQNRYRFYGRSYTGAFVKDDIASWSADDFRRKIAALFQSSLAQEQVLCRVRLDDYSPVIIKGNVRYLRPTLFDLLAHDALEYYIAGELDREKPVNAFEIDDTAAFFDAGAFAAHSFTTSDSSSEYNALTLFQRLTRLHLTDARPDALLDLDIERLQFVHEKATIEDKDERYMAALSRLTVRWPDEPAAAEAWYLIAANHAEKAHRYLPPQDTTGRFEYVAAKAICEKVIAQKDSSQGKSDCIALRRSILEASFSMEVESINFPDQPLRCLLKWSNVSTIYGRIFQADESPRIDGDENPYNDGYWQKLFRRPLVRSFSQALPETGDYQTHSSEIKISALPIGKYAFVACSDSSFPFDKYSKQPMSVIYFYESAISLVSTERDYFVLDREKGQPLKGATVQVWETVYDQKSNKQVSTRKETYSSDEHGHFLMKDRGDDGQIPALEIHAGNDHLLIDFVGYRNFSLTRGDVQGAGDPANEWKNRTTYFFTDRSIYRPGQTLFFKGIVVTHDAQTNRYKVVPGLPTVVRLHDSNGNVVDSIVVTSNAFGSYHGQFKIPVNLLNGRFDLQCDSTFGATAFSVEEYKRPRFFVGFDTLTANYRIGDTIVLSGYAKAFAGNLIDGALVTYRVSRQVHFAYPCTYCVALRSTGASWGGWGSGNEAAQQIVHGRVKTDGDGKFTIRFLAAADKRIAKENDPVFEYAVTADVSDVSNETQSGAAFVRAGYRSLQLGIVGPVEDQLPADSLKTLVVRASNLSGVGKTIPVDVVMYLLRSPDRLIRKRYWPAPDQHLLSKEDYLKDFPHDEYAEETNIEKWEKGEKVFSSADSTGRPIAIADSGRKALRPGWYFIRANAKDKDGQIIMVSRFVELYDGTSGRPAHPEYTWPLRDAAAAAPGQTVKIETGSSAEKVFVVRTVARTQENRPVPGDGGRPFEYFAVDNNRNTEEFRVTEADRGGFVVSDVFVKDNRLYTRTYAVAVPWTNKQLAISYRSFRDKVLPGSKESWAVTIKGLEGDRVNAEVLTAMYDASLDAFKPHFWDTPPLFASYNPGRIWQDDRNFNGEGSSERFRWPVVEPRYVQRYDRLLHSAFERRSILIRGRQSLVAGYGQVKYKDADVPAEALALASPAKPHTIQIPDMVNDPDGSKGLIRDGAEVDDNEVRPKGNTPVPEQLRKNFNETAFFLPDLRTDSAGNVSFSFTMPDAVTSWKWLTLAGTRDAAFGYSEQTVVTQKQLMVEPNVPRFLREGDKMELPVKVINMTDSELTGQMSLQLTDPTTGQTADGWFVNRQPNQYFTVGPRQSAVVAFPLDIPYQYNRPLTYKVVAEAKGYSDGEEATLPVVSNRLLVTESLPLNMPGDGTRQFTFDKLLKSGSSETLNNHALTVEFTANPAWYAVQSLPYMLEHTNECSEQVFSRVYANALASKIANSSPRLQQVFARWRDEDTTQLLSNLEKNEELKTVLLAETPWVLEGKTESQQKKAVAMLFDMGRMSAALEAAIDKLAGMQLPDGSFPWFAGGSGDRYITQYILTGIGHLQKLGAVPAAAVEKMNAIVKSAFPWLDGLMLKDYKYDKAGEYRARKREVKMVGSFAIQYLYMRSLFSDIGVPGNVLPAMTYYRNKVRMDWVQQNKYMQGMIALALYRTGDVQTAKDIIASLKQNAIRDEEKGMYWKGMESGYFWYNAPVETQALLIEAFREIGGDAAIDRALKTWLLKQKQTHNWATTTATADACYALLLGGQDWLNAERSVELRLGDKTVDFPAAGGDAGVGYNKKVFDGPFVNPSMGNISVTMKGGGSPAWGAVYWQYFDMLDRITPPAGKAVLSIRKRLFVKHNTDRGAVLDSLADNGTLKPGDQVVVRVELRADRDLEYVHMKDMRAACMEPVDVISGYRWQDGLGYYQSTKDVSTDFFFDRLPRGTHVFEYTMSASQAGNYSNGITSIECMYAPEFSYHSEGIRVNVDAAP